MTSQATRQKGGDFASVFTSNQMARPIVSATVLLTLLGMSMCAHAESATEVAVLHLEQNRRFALPVLTVPTRDPRQLEDMNMDRRMEVQSESVSSIVRRCKDQETEADDTEIQCPLPSAIVKQAHYMRSVPREWFSATGVKYATLGGRYFEHAVGAGIGFDLGESSSGTNQIVLLSNTSAKFATSRELPATEWQRWPELADELERWRKSQSEACDDYSGCREDAPLFANVSRLRGSAEEFALPDGRKLQYLRATSHLDAASVSEIAADDPLHLLVIFWRMVTPSGSAHVLRDNEEFTVTGLERDQCENQCFGGLGRPEIFTLDGRTFLFGTNSGGTVWGYDFIEVMPERFEHLGSYYWGS